MNRRGFLKGLVGAGAALVLPVEPEKRFFQLDQTMIGPKGSSILIAEDMLARWGRAVEDPRTPFSDYLNAEKARVFRLQRERILWGIQVLDNDVQEGSLGYNHDDGKTYVRFNGQWCRV